MNHYIHYNGQLMPAGTPLVAATNRGLRYGDGLFETLRVIDGRIILAGLHFERLFHGLELLRFQPAPELTAGSLEQAILELCRKMDIERAARVRLNMVRGSGGLLDPEDLHPRLIIEAWPVDIPQNIPYNGLVVDIFDAARKHYDLLSGIKSNNYLPYALAALYAKERQLQECLLLNTEGRICDATIANVFWVKDGELFTPPLTEGGIAGVMRKYLLARSAGGPYPIREALLTPDMLENLDELFLTNAIQGIKWVARYRDTHYTNTVSSAVFQQYIQPLWS